MCSSGFRCLVLVLAVVLACCAPLLLALLVAGCEAVPDVMITQRKAAAAYVRQRRNRTKQRACPREQLERQDIPIVC